jgi:hypothetical protein
MLGWKHHTGPVGPESGSVTAGKGDSFVRAGLPCEFEQLSTLPPLLVYKLNGKTCYHQCRAGMINGSGK